jgi:hypothetical protein
MKEQKLFASTKVATSLELQLLSRSKCSFRTVGGLPNITADGHDAYLSNFFEDPMEHIACEILKEACRKQFEIVGDTSLVCILTQASSKLLRGIKKAHHLLKSKNRIDASVEKY